LTYNNNNNNNKNEEENVYVFLKLNKNIVQLLRIFANTYGEVGDSNTEENKRIDNFLSKEVTKIIQALASDSSGPAQEPFPDSLKQHVKNLLN
jgi:hypothetical protein